jgi:DNA mismatch repair protein MLH1
VDKVYNQLLSRKDMLSEYFSLQISDAGELETIPLMLKGYLPCMAKLPTFLLRLGPCVNWTDEQACFQSFLRELASFYVPERLMRKKDSVEDEPTVAKRRQEMEQLLEHVLFPALRSRIVATQSMLQGAVEVADLKGLYKVFERC